MTAVHASDKGWQSHLTLLRVALRLYLHHPFSRIQLGLVLALVLAFLLGPALGLPRVPTPIAQATLLTLTTLLCAGIFGATRSLHWMARISPTMRDTLRLQCALAGVCALVMGLVGGALLLATGAPLPAVLDINGWASLLLFGQAGALLGLLMATASTGNTDDALLQYVAFIVSGAMHWGQSMASQHLAVHPAAFSVASWAALVGLHACKLRRMHVAALR